MEDIGFMMVIPGLYAVTEPRLKTIYINTIRQVEVQVETY
jgi:hypothetical protein